MDQRFRGTLKSTCAPGVLTFGLSLLAIIALQSVSHSTTLVLAGDIMLGRDVARTHAIGGWDDALADITSYTSVADLAFANLESPLTTASLMNGALDLRAPPEAVAALQAGGIQIVSIANNHTFDAGLPGLKQTMQVLSNAGVQSIGPDHQPRTIYLNDVRLTWIAADDTSGLVDIDRFLHVVTENHRFGGLILISIHWGSELETAPNSRQRYLAEMLAAAGADIIIGHHPHVLQPVEWTWGVGRGRPTLVAYSLGNTLFDQVAPPGVRYSALLQVEIGRLGATIVCAIPIQVDTRRWQTVPAGSNARESAIRNLRLSCVLPASPDLYE
jgi:poly-gamma-glutamate capsule biosynthesis protein CapA/YwtB (metallophosphatase superfamily)